LGANLFPLCITYSLWCAGYIFGGKYVWLLLMDLA
jgi:hypothetical protein